MECPSDKSGYAVISATVCQRSDSCRVAGSQPIGRFALTPVHAGCDRRDPVRFVLLWLLLVLIALYVFDAI